MNTKLQIFLAMVTTATSSFLQTPSNNFEVTFNSTFLNGNERLFRPIIIPNTTRSEQPPRIKETHRTKENELTLKKILQPEESTQQDNYLDEEPKAARFSSRYSTKSSLKAEQERNGKSNEGYSEATQIPNSLETNENSHDEEHTTEVHNSLSNHSGDSKEGKEDVGESREAEESEISPTTNEPYAELQRPTSFQNEDFKYYETTPAEETDSSEEEKEDRSVEDYKDYYNSGSKNYHSIQTPLNKIKYKGPHSYDDDFEPEKTRTRLISPISRRPGSHKWPFSRPPIKQLEKLNEIADSDESYEKALDEGIREEVKTTPNQPDLELAIEKDEFKFDRSKKYNQVEERHRKKQQQKELIGEEEKDDSRPLLLKQYQVDEEQPKHQHRANPTSKPKEGVRSTNSPHTTFKTTKKFILSSNLAPNFQGQQFLGPVVFSQNAEQHRSKPPQKNKQAYQGALKGLLKNEKLDQDNLTNQRFEKSIFGVGSKITQSFNHLEESNEMYNAILANIQSVFGIRTQPLKSGTQKGGGGSVPEASLDESRFLTWSLPLKH